MKILIITADYYPDNTPRSFRATLMVEELSKRGYEVSLMCPDKGKDMYEFNNKMGVIYHELTIPSILKKETNIIIKIIKYILHVSNISTYTYYPIILYKNIVKNKLIELKGYDLLISIAVPHSIHWGVALTLENNNNTITKKWIADCGDPFMGNPITKRWKGFKKYEEKFCRVADYVTIPTSKSINAYNRKYKSKIRIIPQGYKLKISQEKTLKNEKNNIIKFAYAGRFYKNERDPRPFLAYLNSIDKKFEFHIFTNSDKIINKYAKKSKGRIIIHPFIKRRELLIKLSSMDFLVNISNKNDVQVPSKLIDYHIARRPILNIEYKFTPTIFNEFMQYNFRNKYTVQDIEKYNIKNVVDQFLKLT